jgi:hypothetical protein
VRSEASEILRWSSTAPNLHDPRFVRAHNFFTLYVVWWTGYACGIRSIINPLIRPHDVHEGTGVCNWFDKDDGSGYKSRMLWVPEDLLEQLYALEVHVLKVRKELGNPKSIRGISGFFINENNRPELIRPTSIQRLTKDFFDFPANTHRRFMKQALRRNGCPPELVRAWMGHWTSEQEPFNDFSGLSMQAIRAGFMQHVPPLLLSLGFSPLTRPEVKNDRGIDHNRFLLAAPKSRSRGRTWSSNVGTTHLACD